MGCSDIAASRLSGWVVRPGGRCGGPGRWTGGERSGATRRGVVGRPGATDGPERPEAGPSGPPCAGRARAAGEADCRRECRAADERAPRAGRQRQPHRPAHRAVEPPPSRWVFPNDPGSPGRGGRRRRGGRDRRRPGAGHPAGGLPVGLFPMPARRRVMAWWSPDPRGIVPLRIRTGLRVSRSLRKSCAPLRDPGQHRLRRGHRGLRRPAPAGRLDRPGHQAGLPASARAGVGPQRRGVGRAGPAGRRPVRRGDRGLFAGESMFHRQTDASKVALVGLAVAAASLTHQRRRAGAGAGCSTCSGRPRTWCRWGRSR